MTSCGCWNCFFPGCRDLQFPPCFQFFTDNQQFADVNRWASGEGSSSPSRRNWPASADRWLHLWDPRQRASDEHSRKVKLKHNVVKFATFEGRMSPPLVEGVQHQECPCGNSHLCCQQRRALLWGGGPEETSPSWLGLTPSALEKPGGATGKRGGDSHEATFV